MVTKKFLANDWLPRYTGTMLDEFGDYILLTNFDNYVEKFADLHQCSIKGEDRPMQTATNDQGITIINFGIGSPNAATIIDLLTAISPKGILFLGKCGGLKRSTDLGHFILPSAAVRGEGTGNDYMPPELPALPAFELQKFASEQIAEQGQDYRTGVVYTANRRVWEWDEKFKDYLKELGVIGIDMETATLFIVSFANRIPCAAVLLVSDLPMVPEGIKTEKSDQKITKKYVDLHLKIGIEALYSVKAQGGQVKHFRY